MRIVIRILDQNDIFGLLSCAGGSESFPSI